MKNTIRTPLLGLLLALSLVLLGATASLAAGTAAGVTVSNTALLDYQVNGLDQTQKSSTPAVFTVDQLIRPVVTWTDTSAVQVTPTATDQALTFTVKNDGNAAADFNLSMVDPTGNAFDLGSVTYTVNGTGQTFPYTVSIPVDETITVKIIGTVPSTATDAQTAFYDLLATSSVAQTTGGPTSGKDTVFGDAAGSVSGDVALDGKHSAQGEFEVASANMSITKTAEVVDDNLGAGTKFHVPGATVRYTITVENTGSADATTVVVTDTVPAETTYDAGTLQITSGTGTVDASGAPNLSATINTVAASGSAAITFDVTIK